MKRNSNCTEITIDTGQLTRKHTIDRPAITIGTEQRRRCKANVRRGEGTDYNTMKYVLRTAPPRMGTDGTVGRRATRMGFMTELTIVSMSKCINGGAKMKREPGRPTSMNGRYRTDRGEAQGIMRRITASTDLLNAAFIMVTIGATGRKCAMRRNSGSLARRNRAKTARRHQRRNGGERRPTPHAEIDQLGAFCMDIERAQAKITL